MSQFEPTGEQIARELDLERYGDPEKARMRAALIELAIANDRLEELTSANERMRAALETIRLVVTRSDRHGDHAYALLQIDQLARQGLAP